MEKINAKTPNKVTLNNPLMYIKVVTTTFLIIAINDAAVPSEFCAYCNAHAAPAGTRKAFAKHCEQIIEITALGVDGMKFNKNINVKVINIVIFITRLYAAIIRSFSS